MIAPNHCTIRLRAVAYKHEYHSDVVNPFKIGAIFYSGIKAGKQVQSKRYNCYFNLVLVAKIKLSFDCYSIHTSNVLNNNLLNSALST